METYSMALAGVEDRAPLQQCMGVQTCVPGRPKGLCSHPWCACPLTMQVRVCRGAMHLQRRSGLQCDLGGQL